MMTLHEVLLAIGDKGVAEINEALAKLQPKNEIEKVLLGAVSEVATVHGQAAAATFAAELARYIEGKPFDPKMFEGLDPETTSNILLQYQRAELDAKSAAADVLRRIGEATATIALHLVRGLVAAA